MTGSYKLARSRSILSLTFAALSLALMSSCASPGPKVDQAALSRIKTIAIVGFTAHQEFPKDRVTELQDEAMAEARSSMPGMARMANVIPTQYTFAKVLPPAEAHFGAVNGWLKTELGWSVKPVATVASREPYKGEFSSTMKNWKNHRSDNGQIQMMYLKDIIAFKEALELPRIARDNLIKDLGVDAIAMVDVRNLIDEGSSATVGIGGLRLPLGVDAKRSVSEVRIAVYAPGSDDPVWMDMAKGEPSKEALQFTDWTGTNTNLTKISLDSANQALRALIARAKGSPGTK